MLRILMVTVLMAGPLLAGAAMAEPVTGKVAKGQIFGTTAEVKIVDGIMPKDQAAALKTVLAGQPYYGAAALSPDDGLMSEATVLLANYHDIASASKAALAQCDAKRKGKTPCVIAATVQPKGWKQRQLQLSADATKGFKTSYPASGGALATSATSGGWALGGVGAAALAACAAQGKKPKDCAVVIAN